MSPSAVPPTLREVCSRLSNNDRDLISLNLAGLKIGNNGAEALARSLEQNTALQSLTLCYNLISGSGALSLLAPRPMKEIKLLDLRYNAIGDDGANALAEAIKSRNATLQNVSIRDNFVGPRGVVRIAEALERNSSVEHLDLGKNNLGIAGAASIAKSLAMNQALRCLYLRSSRLNAEGVKLIASALRDNTTLEVLSLEGNEIGDIGAEALADALRYNTTLRSLHLANTRIGSHGALVLARLLATNKNLSIVDILHNPIGLDGAAAFRGVLKNCNRTIQHLRLDYQFVAVENFYFKDVNAEILIYLKLNQKGRAQMTNVKIPWGTWPNILEKVNVQPDMMYLTLHEKPDLLKREQSHMVCKS